MYDELVAALLGVGVPVYRYEALEQPDRYIVWAEDGAPETQYADNHMQEQVAEGTIDFFTKSESDEVFEKIQDALIEFDISFIWNSTQYERDTGFIHHEWVFRVEVL